MFERFWLTGKIVPPNGLLSRFHNTLRPTLPGRSEAPTNATLRGLKIGSRGWPCALRTSWAGLDVSFPPRVVIFPILLPVLISAHLFDLRKCTAMRRRRLKQALALWLGVRKNWRSI